MITMTHKQCCKAAGLLLAMSTASVLTAAKLNFNDLVLPEDITYWNGANGSGGFTSGGLWFANNFTDWGGGFTSWEGFAYSNEIATTSGSYDKQYALYQTEPLEGACGCDVHLVAYRDAVVTIPDGYLGNPLSADLANSAYTASSILIGDAFSKKFGGAAGTDPDYLRVDITGYNDRGAPTGKAEVYLADYRGTTGDMLLTAWTNASLSALGTGVKTIRFSFAGSDYGTFGLNTPAYLVMDNLDIELIPQAIPGAADLGHGWKESWLGVHYDAYAPWVWHNELGWLYLISGTEDTWIHEQNLGWLWTNESIFPWVYAFGEGKFLYYIKGTSKPALFYDGTAIVSVPKA
ncbi:MAG: DUF4465 domain-containing protein [Verrucomicrobiota bacterium]|nr:DUF4465 domain-containing protein [Verrucomicrobiota bacterium]